MSTEPQVRIPNVRAIARDRVDALLDRAWEHRLTLVIAPPGAGKTTAVASFAARAQHAVAWLGYPTADRAGAALIGELEYAVKRAVPDRAGGWVTAADAARALESLPHPLAIVVDDIHRVAGTPAEQRLADFIGAVPQGVHVVLAGRRSPDLRLGGLELAGQVLVIDGDQLRFRTWEAERLFREQYETFLPPDDVARIARQVDGWAAGLQLFHLASRGRDPVAQRQLIEQMQGRNKIVRQYLATNVLEPLPSDLRRFLVDTCVLGVVTADLADELRGSTGSSGMLGLLAASQMFTTLIADDTYRYHDVLRSHLEQLLLERDGAAAAADRFRMAGLLQEKAGWPAEALRCYARAGDWFAVRSLLGSEQLGPAAATRALFDVLPPAVVVDDPWLLLARARTEVASGQLDQGMRSLDSALAASSSSEFSAVCRAERAELSALLRPGESHVTDWISIAQAGARRSPANAAEQLATMGPAARLAGALLAVIAGDCSLAVSLAERTFVDPHSNDFSRVAALGLQVVLRVARGEPGAERNLDDAAEYAERAGVGWTARVLRAAEALTDRPTGVDDAVRAADQAVADGDEWGAAIATALAAFGQARRGQPSAELFERAQRRLIRLGATAAVAMCSLAQTLHASGDLAVSSAYARQHGLPLSLERVLAVVLRLPNTQALRQRAVAAPPTDPECTLELRVLGTFELCVDGRRVDLAVLRPKARTLFKVLAVAGGRPVPRDSIIEAVWPDAEPDAALHNLQVAVSAVRRLLGTEVGPTAGVVRSGTSYRLDLGTAAGLDVQRFDELFAEARDRVVSSADRAAAAAAALALYRGELLADDGPVEWLQRPRSMRDGQHEQLAVLLAHHQLENDQATGAIDVCESALLHHPYCDQLWRTLVAANRARGDTAAANQAEARYARMLEDLSS